MDEYIKRDDVLDLLTNRDVVINPNDEVAFIREDVECLPAADVRPVVKASWQYKTITVPGGKGQTYAKWRCTACKGKAKERTNFCPNCGADMREES